MVKEKVKQRTGKQRWGATFRLDFIGTVTGAIFFCLSFTPSLLPRGYVVQGVAAALSFATGYGLGVAVSHVYHHVVTKKYQYQLPSRYKRLVLVLCALLGLGFMIAGFHWQTEIRNITQASSASADYPVRVLVIAAILSYLLIWMGRGIRKLSRFCGRQISRFLPRKVSRYLGAAAAAVLLAVLVNGILLRAVFGFISFSFGLVNKGTPDGIYQPQSSLYSGSPASLIDWNSLGEKGREFVASAPSKSDIAGFAGSDAQQPSRLYVGLESAPTLKERVNLLVKELDRTHAADRKVVLIAIPTGSGGVNAKAIESVEYLYHGDTSSLAIQYSYLPSWLSFIADQEIARDNGRVLTEAVYDWWSHLDANQRPKLLMYGESLGTFGADGAFSGASDMANRMNGVLLVGPPNANHLWSGMVADRDANTPQVLPIYHQGEIVRFSDGKTSLTANPSTNNWGRNRVGIIQHASDPVIWASTSLLWQKPDWLKEPRGYDVLPNMRWYPFVTGWQVALDLPFAFHATSGHGHRYGDSLTSSWIQILDLELSDEKTVQLQKIIDHVKG